MSRARDLADAGSKANFLDNVTANVPADVQTLLDAKAPLASPDFTGTVDLTNGDLLLKRGSATSSLTRQITIGGTRNGSSSKYAELVFQNYDSDGSATDYAGASISAYIDNDATDGGELSFSTSEDASGTSEKMRINSSGDVGIGVSSSLANRLHVEKAGSTVATFRTSNNNSAGGIELVGKNSSGTIQPFYLQSNASAELLFLQGSGATERMKIDSSGSITTPNGEFNGEIGSSATFASSLFNKGNNGYVILPSGIEIKWGETSTISSIGTSSSHTHTYTSNQGGAFGTATLWGIVWTADRNASPVAVGGVSGNITVNDSNSSITFNTNSVAGSSGSSIRFLFLAIGH